MESTTNRCRAVRKRTSGKIAAYLLSVIMLFSIGQAEAQSNIYAEDFLSSNIMQASSMPNLSVTINASFEDTPLLEVLAELAEKGSLDLNFNRSSFDQNIRITKNLQGVNLLEALHEVTTEAGIHFYISDSGQLILTPRELPSNTGTLRGRILDASNSEPLVGTTIYITELERGDVADIDGFFEILRHIFIASIE